MVVMENGKKETTQFRNDLKNHYPVILIYLSLVCACFIIGKVTNWAFFGFLFYALLAVGILYLLCFLPRYFISLKEDKLSTGFKTSVRGISLVVGITCAFLLMFSTWDNWHLGSGGDTIYVYVSKAGKYHKKTCKYYHDGMEKKTLSEAEDEGIVPAKCCNK